MTLHKVSEDWLIALEKKLHLVSRKQDRISKRTENILAVVDEVRQKAEGNVMSGKSSKKHLNWWERFKLYLAHLFGK